MAVVGAAKISILEIAWQKSVVAKCVGPRPTWLLVLPAIYFHFMNNFLAGMMPTEGGAMILVLLQDLITLVCAFYLFLTFEECTSGQRD